MICFYSSGDDNHAIKTTNNDVDAPKICAELELERNDGFSVYASRCGEIVAYADGWCDRREGAPPFDAATATGMYDAW